MQKLKIDPSYCFLLYGTGHRWDGSDQNYLFSSMEDNNFVVN